MAKVLRIARKLPQTWEETLANIRAAVELALETRLAGAGNAPSRELNGKMAGNLNDDLAPGTLNSILKQAQLKKEGK